MTGMWSIEKAIISTFNADSEWIALVGEGKVYSSLAPKGAALPYMVVGVATERGTGVIKGSNTGFDNSKIISLFSDEVGKEKCNAMYLILFRLLHNQKLTLDQGRIVSGKVQLISMSTDPSEEGEHGIVNYSVVTRN